MGSKRPRGYENCENLINSLTQTSITFQNR